MNPDERKKAEAIIEAADNVLDTLPKTLDEMLDTLFRIEDKLDTLTCIEDKLDYLGGMLDEDE